MPFLTSLCSCSDDCTGCWDIVMCCPCAVGRQISAARGVSDQVNVLFCLGAMFPLWNVGEVLRIRQEVKQRYFIDEEEESKCSEVWYGCCCPMCSLCQTSRELNRRGDVTTGHTLCPQDTSIV